MPACVYVAAAHGRELPELVHEAARSEVDPDKRILVMLGARGKNRGAAIGSPAVRVS